MLADRVLSLPLPSSTLDGVEVQYDPVEVLGNMLWLMAGLALPLTPWLPCRLESRRTRNADLEVGAPRDAPGLVEVAD